MLPTLSMALMDLCGPETVRPGVKREKIQALADRVAELERSLSETVIERDAFKSDAITFRQERDLLADAAREITGFEGTTDAKMLADSAVENVTMWREAARQTEQSRDDYRADYLRRHKDACDRADELRELRSYAERLKGLALDACIEWKRHGPVAQDFLNAMVDLESVALSKNTQADSEKWAEEAQRQFEHHQADPDSWPDAIVRRLVDALESARDGFINLRPETGPMNRQMTKHIEAIAAALDGCERMARSPLGVRTAPAYVLEMVAGHLEMLDAEGSCAWCAESTANVLRLARETLGVEQPSQGNAHG